MKNNKENEELQSRREFFKQAAKKALPVIGAIVLASSPIIAQASDNVSMGCDTNCTGGCSSSCTSCYGACSGTCKGSCQGTCTGACMGACSGSAR